jgi:hypothetical protein
MKYLSIIAFTFLLFACYGWGYLAVRCISFRERYDFAFLSVVGIACLIFLGGVLNFARLAYPVTLSFLLLSGMTFTVIHYSANRRMWLATWHTGSPILLEKLKSISGYSLPLCLLFIAVGFYASTLLPAAAFNYADDLYTYIPRPLKMLQTGTLAGSPYEVLGTDSLGAHAFLQGFVLLGFPVEYLQGFEAVFSFALTGLLLIAFGRKFSLHWSYTAAALLGLIFINPQSVNISPIYLGSAFILGISYASCQLLEQMEKSNSETISIIAPGIFGLLIAGLVELKTTFVVFAFAYITLFLTGLMLISNKKLRVLKIALLVISSSFLALLPWLALYIGNFITAIKLALHTSAATSSVNTFTALKGNISGLISTADLFYGGSFLSYGVIVLTLVLIGIYCLFKTFSNNATPSQRGYFLVGTASCSAAILTYFFFGAVFPAEPAVRYSCPALIASLPFAFLVASIKTPDSLRKVKTLSQSGMKIAMVLSMTLLIVILFWTNFVERVKRAYYFHHTISFPIKDPVRYLENIRHVLSSDMRQEILEIQNRTQPGEKILVWISLPMHLDFSRNEIYSIMSSSLLNPWLGMPFDGNADNMVKYLKGQGVRYIMWEPSGGNLENSYRRSLISSNLGNQKVAERGLYLRKMLSLIMNGGSFLYNANGIVLFDLQQIND